MRTDSDILKDVAAELKWEPGLRDDDIAVSVRDGVVTLAGFADSFADKWRAERVARKRTMPEDELAHVDVDRLSEILSRKASPEPE